MPEFAKSTREGDLSIEGAIAALRRRLADFKREGWYGEIVIKLEEGRIRHVEARPVIRDYQAR